MNLRARIERLERLAPVHHRRNRVPTGSLTEFVRGLLTGAFRPGDIDPTDPDQTTLLAEFRAYLVMLSPQDQAWADANPWARDLQVQWERANLALSPAEFEILRALAPGAAPAPPVGTTAVTAAPGSTNTADGFGAAE